MSTMGAVAIWGPVAPATTLEVPGPVAGMVHGSVRLTRRGRLLRTAVLVALSLALLLVGVARLTSAPARAGSEAGGPVAVAEVTVEQGDSLWVIAERVAPGRDPRDVIHELREINGLSSNLLQPGQVLLVPSGL
jgi:nucleoid-associated protein YgaU